MTLSQYVSYAVVTSLFVLILTLITLTLKSWFDRRTFRANTVFGIKTSQVWSRHWLSDDDGDFDNHVESTPGMNSNLK